MTREITLSRGYVALVDDEDYDWLMVGGKWSVRGHEPHLYAGRTIWEGKKCHGETMHRLILPTTAQVDHINGDTLDNRRSNLREATPSQNSANRKRRADSRNKYKGVGRTAGGGAPWLAAITVEGQSQHIGVFDTEEEAARAYDKFARALFGDFARLNFPVEAVS